MCSSNLPRIYILQILAALVLGFDAGKLYYGVGSVNATAGVVASGGDDARRNVNAAIAVSITVQSLTIIVSISMMVVAILHRAALRNLLFIWLGYTGVGVTIIVILTIVGAIRNTINGLEIAINLIFFIYQIICIWLVASYYKLLTAVQNQLGHAESLGFTSNKEPI